MSSGGERRSNRPGTDEPAPELVAARFRITGLVGVDPPVAAYRAQDPDGGAVIVRLVHLGEPGEAAELIRRIRLVDLFAGDSVMPLLASGHDEALGAVYLVTRALPGLSLADLLDREGPLSPSVAVRIACQVGDALRRAHRAAVLHLGLRPGMVLLAETGGDVLVKVVGFGLPPPPLGDGAPLPTSLAPEQILAGAHTDERTDVWALGVLLYAMLTGAPPLAHVRRAGELRAALTRRAPPAIQDAAPWIPPRLAEIVHGALLVDPRRRCPAIDDLVSALQPHTGGTWQVRAPMLVGASDDLRSQRAAPANHPASWDALARELDADQPARGDTDRLIGKSLGRGYKLERLIGRGGMAAVYEAELEGRRFAVKVILDEERDEGTVDTGGARRFAREARAVTAISDPHVVQVLEVDVDPRLAKPFIAMELLEGEDLDHLIERVGPLAAGPVVRLVLQAASGLASAHAQGVVHRDVKPANIFLHRLAGGEVVAKVCDFGLAKLGAGHRSLRGPASLTRTGTILGSPRYMSPEQARDSRKVDARSDLWGLCASLYEALSGQRIWDDARTINELIVAIASHDVTPLVELAPWVDPALAAVVHRGLVRDPQGRWQDLGELAAALEPFANVGPVRVDALVRASAAPPPPPATAAIERDDATTPTTRDRDPAATAVTAVDRPAPVPAETGAEPAADPPPAPVELARPAEGSTGVWWIAGAAALAVAAVVVWWFA